MSRENVEIIKCAYQAFAEGRFDAAADMLDPDIEWIPPEPFSDRRNPPWTR